MSSATTGSRAVTCTRQMFDGSTCGRPIVPVFGAWPEECTSCATRVMVSSKDGREAFEKILDDHYERLRRLAVAAAIPGNEWRADGLDLKRRFEMLEKLERQLASRRLMRSIGLAQRLSGKGKTTHEVKRVSLGYRWNSVSSERAIELKKSGFDVRFIGVGWQVRVS